MKKYLFLIFSLLAVCKTFAQTGLKVGADAPLFSVKDNNGKTVDLKSIIKSHKAVVLFFYRGQWCPYCNKQISHLQDSLQLLTGEGAYVVGVTPETSENINKTIEKTHASFSIIQDKGYAIMKDYRVNYTVGSDMLSKYKNYGIDLEKNNGNTDHVLPVPATYIIGKNGKLIYVHFNPDYTKRPSVSKLLNAIKGV
ncbi:MAG TPA: peroxiredoxin family protein [Mucilaginibacter sp.]|jgi:peroxiredoxin|nr:peroxiredoxin family protein [Mucilaginibacter sp.]